MSSSDSDTVQSPQMRKYILRSALKTAQGLSENVNKNTIANLEYIMDKTDILAQEINMEEIVNDHEEVVLDAHVMSLSSNIMRRCTVNVTKEINNYDPQEFSENIKTFMARQANTAVEDFNWNMLTNYIISCFHTMPKFKSLQGVMVPPEDKETRILNLNLMAAKREMIRREPKMPTKRPKRITVAEKDEESVEDSVEKVKTTVKEYYQTTDHPLHFFQLVIHPTNFGKTVENLLHTAFLVRDGVFRLLKDKDGALTVEIVSKKELHEAKKSNKQMGIQNVFSINVNEWKALTEAYKIKKPMLDFKKKKER